MELQNENEQVSNNDTYEIIRQKKILNNPIKEFFKNIISKIKQYIKKIKSGDYDDATLKLQHNHIRTMIIKGSITLILNFLIYVVLLRYIFNNLDDLLENANLPLEINFTNKTKLINLFTGVGVMISCCACIKSASPKKSILKLVAFFLQIFFSAMLYSIFIATGNNILELDIDSAYIDIGKSIQIYLNITNLIRYNIGLQFCNLFIFMLQAYEFLFSKYKINIISKQMKNKRMKLA